MKAPSKIVKNISFFRMTPVFPPMFSHKRTTDRIAMMKEATYKAMRCFLIGISLREDFGSEVARRRSVGLRERLYWNFPAVKTKMARKRICSPNPIMTSRLPRRIQLTGMVVIRRRTEPTARIMVEKQSKKRKIFWKRLRRIGESFSPPTARTMCS